VPGARQTLQHGGAAVGCQNKPGALEQAMAQEFLLVDAHNAIFARSDLSALHRRNPAAAREELVRRLERHQDASGVRVVAVFDGGARANATSEMSGGAGVQVMYPRSGQTADAIIERLVLKYAATHRLTVATNDNLIRTAAVAAGASTMDVETLSQEMASSEGAMRETLDKLRARRR